VKDADATTPQAEEEDKYLELQRQKQEELRERNKTEFGEEGEGARLQHEGFRSGLYVRILLKEVPVEFIRVRTYLESALEIVSSIQLLN
jgi:hypothetical protein